MNSKESQPNPAPEQPGPELSPSGDSQPRRHPGVIALETVQRWIQPAIMPDGTDYARQTIAHNIGADPNSPNSLDKLAIDTTLKNLGEVATIIPMIQKDGSLDTSSFTDSQKQAYTTALNLAVSVELQAAQEDRTFDALDAAADAYKAADLTEDEVVDLQKKLASVEEKDHIDELTGLSNKAGHERWLEIVLKNERSHPIYGIEGDGINLKRFNNLFGMAVGDAILRHLGEELKTISKRKANTLINYTRLHGDEFSILMAGFSAKDVKGMVKAFRKRQRAKDNSAFFERIEELRDAGQALNAEVKTEIVDGKEIEFLFVNDENMGPVGNLAVLGVGTSGLPITSQESLVANRGLAEKNMVKPKKKLYKKNGGQYRTA